MWSDRLTRGALGQLLGELDVVQTVQGDDQDQNCTLSRRYYNNILGSSESGQYSCTGQLSPPG